MNRNQSVVRNAKDRDGWQCLRCQSTKNLEVHHVEMLCRGGLDVLENCATLCRECHREIDLLGVPVKWFKTWLLTPKMSVIYSYLLSGQCDLKSGPWPLLFEFQTLAAFMEEVCGE